MFTSFSFDFILKSPQGLQHQPRDQLLQQDRCRYTHEGGFIQHLLLYQWVRVFVVNPHV